MTYVTGLELDGEYVEGLAKVRFSPKVFKVLSFVYVPVDYIEKCISHLDNLSDELLCKLQGFLYKYAMDRREYLDTEKDAEKIRKIYGGGPHNILSCVTFQNILIKGEDGVTITRSTIPTYSIECRCLWEYEHGLEIVIKGDEIKYVGMFNNIPLWQSDDYYKKVSGNYVFDNSDDIDDECVE